MRNVRLSNDLERAQVLGDESDFPGGMTMFRRPAQSSRVRIHVPGVAPIPGLVVAPVPGASELALPRRRNIETRFLHRQTAVLTFSTGQELTGTLLAYEAEDGGLRSDRIQLLHSVVGAPARPIRESVEDQIVERAAIPLSRLDEDRAEDLAEEPQHLQYVRDHVPGSKRRGVRVQLIRPVAIVPENFKVGWLNGSLRNVSIGGMPVSGAEQMQVGDGLRVRFRYTSQSQRRAVPRRPLAATHPVYRPPGLCPADASHRRARADLSRRDDVGDVCRPCVTDRRLSAAPLARDWAGDRLRPDRVRHGCGHSGQGMPKRRGMHG